LIVIQIGMPLGYPFAMMPMGMPALSMPLQQQMGGQMGGQLPPSIDPRMLEILNTLAASAALTQQQIAINAIQNPVQVSISLILLYVCRGYLMASLVLRSASADPPDVPSIRRFIASITAGNALPHARRGSCFLSCSSTTNFHGFQWHAYESSSISSRRLPAS
jgi:hypothetical protein